MDFILEQHVICTLCCIGSLETGQVQTGLGRTGPGSARQVRARSRSAGQGWARPGMVSRTGQEQDRAGLCKAGQCRAVLGSAAPGIVEQSSARQDQAMPEMAGHGYK